MVTRYKSVEAAELVPLESFQSDPCAQSNMTVHPSSPVPCQNLKCDRLLGGEEYVLETWIPFAALHFGFKY